MERVVGSVDVIDTVSRYECQREGHLNQGLREMRN